MIYAFEEIGQDLARPPLAARRALLAAGVAVPLETWQALPLDARKVIAAEGVKESVSEFVVKNAVSPVLKRVRFMGPVRDPPIDSPPPNVLEALRMVRPLTAGEWRGLTPLDRYTLVALASNSRLLYRAVEEMAGAPNSSLSSIKLRPWIGALAHSEVRMSRQALTELSAGRMMDGKAFVLARTAGVRTARHANELLDGYAEKFTGPVELDSRLDFEMGGVVFQAHVSTADGEFFAPASVLAAAAAAVALRDAVATRDPNSVVGEVTLREEAWSVGSSGFGEEATVTMDAKAYHKQMPLAEPSGRRLVDSPPEPSARVETRTGLPIWVAVLLVLTTLMALAAAGATMYPQHLHL